MLPAVGRLAVCSHISHTQVLASFDSFLVLHSSHVKGCIASVPQTWQNIPGKVMTHGFDMIARIMQVYKEEAENFRR